MTKVEQIWRKKSDRALLKASKELSDYTEDAERIIRAELQRRDLPAPSYTTRYSDPITEDVIGIGNRYGDAYTIAHGVTNLGGLIKTVGVVIAILIALLGVMQSGFMTFIMILVASSVGFLLWISGVFVTALGQISRASIDTAVNTSPFAGNSEKARIMGIRMPKKNTQGESL